MHRAAHMGKVTQEYLQDQALSSLAKDPYSNFHKFLQ